MSDIPGLGELFKSRSKSRSKTNLMVFIRPTILRSKEDAQRLTQQRYGYVRNMQMARNPDAEPSIDELVRDYMGATPPAPMQAGDAVVQPTAEVQAPPQVIEPSVRQSSGVVRPVAVPASGGRR